MGYVYVIGNGRGDYKIGQTDNQVERRLRQLQHSSPDKLDIIHVIPHISPFNLEQELHREFAKKRLRGEWFRLNLDDLRKITKGAPLTTTWPILAELEPKLGEVLKRAQTEWLNEPEDYCGIRVWYGYGHEGEKVGAVYGGRGHGLKSLVNELVGWTAKHNGAHKELCTSLAYDIAYETVFDALPPCRGLCGCSV